MGKVISFLILLLVSQSLLSQEIFLNNGQTIVDIDPKGSFLPIDQYTGFPPLDVPPNPATSIDVSNLPAGALIKVRRLGGVSNSQFEFDDSRFATMGVFVNATGVQLAAGPKTTANSYPSFFFCKNLPSEVEYDSPYDLNLSGNGVTDYVDFILEVPAGAKKLLVAPADCPVQDNDDLNNNYKLQITYPIIEKVDIYQVVKNPILYAPSTTIDLVAGKNADIVVKTVPNVNVEGSYIEWRDANNSEATKKIFNLKPGQTTSTGSGDVTFYIDPVPKEASFIAGETQPRVFLRGKNISGITIDLDTSNADEVKTKIHRTKPIRLGFVPISGCVDDKPGHPPCFAAPSSNDVTNMAQYGSEIMKAMYPVAEDELFADYFIKEFRVPKAYSNNADSAYFDYDILVLESFRMKFVPKYIDFVVGVMTDSYRAFRGILVSGNPDPIDDVSVLGSVIYIPSPDQAFLGYMPRSLFVSSSAYFTLPHEVGHALSLNHTCHPNKCSDLQNTYDGYSNYDNLTKWALLRSEVGDRYPLMQYGTGFFGFIDTTPNTKKKWISRQEYLRLFSVNKVNLIKESDMEYSSVDSSNLRVSGEIKSDNFYLVTANIFSNDFLTIPNEISGDYKIELLNQDKNVIYTTYKSAYKTVETEKTFLTFDLKIGRNAQFIKIYNVSKQLLIKEIPIISALIESEVYNINPLSIKIDYGLLKEKMILKSKEMEKELICQNYYGANKIISTEFVELVNNNFSSYSNSNSYLIDSKKMKQTLINGSLRLVEAQKNIIGYNPLISPCVSSTKDYLGFKSKIVVRINNNLNNKAYSYIVKALFDGREVNSSSEGRDYIFQTGYIVNGQHNWKLSIYLVNIKNYNRILKSIWQSEENLRSFKKLLSESTNEDEKNKYNQLIDVESRRLATYHVERQSAEKPVGNAQQLNIEVQQ